MTIRYTLTASSNTIHSIAFYGSKKNKKKAKTANKK